MCLYHDGRPTIHTATKDIRVVKFISHENKSIMQGFQYEPHTTYRLRKALHAYPTGCYVGWTKDSNVEFGVDEGFHSWLEKYERYERYSNKPGKFVSFVIPKGAKYILGIDGGDRKCYVSTSIRSGSLNRIR